MYACLPIYCTVCILLSWEQCQHTNPLDSRKVAISYYQIALLIYQFQEIKVILKGKKFKGDVGL